MALVVPPLTGLVADARRLRGVALARSARWPRSSPSSASSRAQRAPSSTRRPRCSRFFRAPLTSLVDATTLEHVRHHGGSYGRSGCGARSAFSSPRAGGGRAHRARPASASSSASAAWALGACALVAFALPAAPPAERKGVVGAWLHLLGERRLVDLLRRRRLGADGDGGVRLGLLAAPGAARLRRPLHRRRVGHGRRRRDRAARRAPARSSRASPPARLFRCRWRRRRCAGRCSARVRSPIADSCACSRCTASPSGSSGSPA